MVSDKREGGDLWIGHEEFGDVQADTIRIKQVANHLVHFQIGAERIAEAEAALVELAFPNLGKCQFAFVRTP